MLAFFSVAAAGDLLELQRCQSLDDGGFLSAASALLRGKSKVGILRKCPLGGAIGLTTDPGLEGQALASQMVGKLRSPERI